MTRRKTKKEKNRLVLIFLVMSALLIYFGCNVYTDFIKIKDNKKQTTLLTSKYENLLDQKKSLESEATKMQDPKYVARYAKEKYLYSKENEIIIRMED